MAGILNEVARNCACSALLLVKVATGPSTPRSPPPRQGPDGDVRVTVQPVESDRRKLHCCPKESCAFCPFEFILCSSGWDNTTVKEKAEEKGAILVI